MRTVTGHVEFTPGSQPVGVLLKLDKKQVDQNYQPPNIPFTLHFTETLKPGKHELIWFFTGSCGFGSYPFDVPPCPGCPNVEFEMAQGSCEGGKRLVTVTAKIPDQGVPVDAALLYDGKKLDQISKTGPIVLQATDLFSGGVNKVTVELSHPPGCSTENNFYVSPCIESTGDGGGDEESGECFVGRILVVLAFATAIFFILLLICTGNSTYLAPAGGALAVAGLLFWLWWLLCGTNCGLLLIVWESAFMGAWAAAYIAPCCPPVWIAAGGLAALAATFAIVWANQCKPSACRAWVELAWVTGVAGAIILAGLPMLLTTILSCDPQLQQIVGTAHGLALTLLLALVAKHCAKPAGG
jgi:hypothetical protein